MENEKLDALLKSFAALVSPYIIENVVDHLASSGILTTEVNRRIQDQINDLGQIDKEMIADVVRAELAEADVVTSSALDDALSELPSEERVSELAADAVEGAVDERLENVLEDAVMDILRYKITFTVEAS